MLFRLVSVVGIIIGEILRVDVAGRIIDISHLLVNVRLAYLVSRVCDVYIRYQLIKAWIPTVHHSLLLAMLLLLWLLSLLLFLLNVEMVIMLGAWTTTTISHSNHIVL